MTVEVPLHQVALMQKMMVKACNLAGKPVIVATQMLESMQKNPRPTRAEVADITNAVCDGADAVMLSGESANGSFPIESIETMNAIVDAADYSEESYGYHQPTDSHVDGPSEAAASASVLAATKMGASVIVVVDSSGDAARYVAKYRPAMPVMAVVQDPKVARQLMLNRGIHPFVLSTEEAALAEAKAGAFGAAGDTAVVLNCGGSSPTMTVTTL